LTTGEFAVLKALVEHPREPLTRDKLMNLARGRVWDALERSIDVQVSRLRRMIEPDPSKPRYIQTLWGVGYAFVPDGCSYMMFRSLYPQSFFARTLWMVLLAVLFSKALILVYLMLHEDVLVDRQYSHGAALTLRAYWASPPSERAVIAKAAGLQLVAEHEVPMGEKHWPYSDIFSEQMRAELGEDTR